MIPVRYDAVYGEVSAFSRAVKSWTKAGSQIAPVVHRYVMNRYLKSVWLLTIALCQVESLCAAPDR